MADRKEHMPEERPEIELQGVATLFKTAEMRKFVIRYLYGILSLEVFIFLVFFLCQLHPINIPFSWKNFFMAALIMPIAATFLTGVFVTAFNFFFMSAGTAAPTPEAAAENPPHAPEAPWHQKLQTAIGTVHHQMPFLLSLMLLCVVVVAIMHIDRFFAFLAGIGEAAIGYLFWGAAVLLGGATLLAVVFLISRYRLEKDRQQQEFQYRREMALRMGVIITGKKHALHVRAEDPGKGGGGQKLLTHHSRPGEEQS
jgi:hypothetical protein